LFDLTLEEISSPPLRRGHKTGFPETEIAPEQLGDSLIPSEPLSLVPRCPWFPLEFTHVLEQPMP
jgi:hypothetical protein